MDGTSMAHGEVRNVYKILIGKPEGNRPLGKHWRRWEDNIRMDVRKIGREGVDWIHLAQERNQWQVLMNMIMNLRFALKAENF